MYFKFSGLHCCTSLNTSFQGCCYNILWLKELILYFLKKFFAKPEKFSNLFLICFLAKHCLLDFVSLKKPSLKLLQLFLVRRLYILHCYQQYASMLDVSDDVWCFHALAERPFKCYSRPHRPMT